MPKKSLILKDAREELLGSSDENRLRCGAGGCWHDRAIDLVVLAFEVA